MARFTIPTKIIAGSDSLNMLQTFTNQRVFFVCDPFLDDSDTLKMIQGHLPSSATIQTFADVKPNPPLTSITAGVKEYLAFKPTVIVVLGGGSAIDTAKAIRSFGEKVSGETLSCFVAIPTTSGTGSEVTNTAVVSDEANHAKFPLIDDHLIPDVALLYPELVVSAPSSVTAFSGLDVMTHSLESLVAKDANLFTDALAEKAIDVIGHDLVAVYRDPENLALRRTVHEASTAAGLAFNTAGLGITHSIAHQLGAQFHVPHGLACAMMLPHVVAFNAQDKTVQAKYAAAARKAGLASADSTDRMAVRELIRKLQTMMRQMKCPQTLAAFGVKPADARAACATIVAAAKTDGTFPGNPIVPTDEQLAEVYQQVIE
ncbi:1-propanol dehydrogenase PduQ [Furfurilactobacillus sp. WILCCON 0119]